MNDLMMNELLDDYINRAEVVGDAPGDSEFAIHDDLTAEWALQKIAVERAESARLNAMRQAMIQAIDDENASCARRCARLEGLLAAYFDSVPHRATKTQESYALLSGKLVRKRLPPRFTRDDDALAGWLMGSGNGDLVETKLAPKWGELKKRGVRVLSDGACALEETGEIIDGVTAEIPAPVFQVELREGPRP